ncbi:MAG: hypothetical protein JXB13_15645, partial [Phycisphaerae bacterium]|nr:hypothetical protein [Phycisphaerae bacterium]
RSAQAAALAQMKADAQRIAFLQEAPRRAADRLKPNDELLAEVDAALEAAQVSRDHWNDSVPQPPERLAGADYTRWTVRLYLEDVPMQAFTRFVHALLGADPTLYLASLRIQPARRNAGGNADATWNVEMAVAYDVYAPAEKGEGRS